MTYDDAGQHTDNSLIIYGRNPVLEALKSQKNIDILYVHDFDAKGSITEIIAKAKQKGIIVKKADQKKLDMLSGGGVHQGVVATMPAIKYSELDDIFKTAKQKGEPPFIILADEIEDPHNLGAIIRTADAAGAHGIIIPKRRSATVNATVYKTSAGACAHIHIVKVSNISDTLLKLKEKNVWTYGADMHGQNVWQTNFDGGVALVIGSEGKGLGTLVKKRCDVLVSLPMNGNVNSLNASVAGGILMYEIVRNRLK